MKVTEWLQKNNKVWEPDAKIKSFCRRSTTVLTANWK